MPTLAEFYDYLQLQLIFSNGINRGKKEAKKNIILFTLLR